MLFALLLSIMPPPIESKLDDRPIHVCQHTDEVKAETLFKNYQAIAIGETHGTNEMPAALTEFIHEASESNKIITLALEYEEKRQANLDLFFSNEDQLGFARQDGRTSKAMHRMLSSVKSLKQNGANIDVVAVDYWPENESNVQYTAEFLPADVDIVKSQRNIGMGINAVKACNDHDCGLLIYYAGNAHIRRQISQSAQMDETGITYFNAAPAAFVMSHYMKTASVFLSHQGGKIAANVDQKGFGTFNRKANTPSYVQKDEQLYCHGESKLYDYIYSVGKVTYSK